MAISLGATQTNDTSSPFSHTVDASATMLVVGVVWYGGEVTGITWTKSGEDAQSLTEAASTQTHIGEDCTLYYLINPNIGAGQIAVSCTVAPDEGPVYYAINLLGTAVVDAIRDADYNECNTCSELWLPTLTVEATDMTIGLQGCFVSSGNASWLGGITELMRDVYNLAEGSIATDFNKADIGWEDAIHVTVAGIVGMTVKEGVGPYAVTKHILGPGSAAGVAAEIETTLEAIDNTKTIHKLRLEKDSRSKGQTVGILIIDE